MTSQSATLRLVASVEPRKDRVRDEIDIDPAQVAPAGRANDE